MSGIPYGRFAAAVRYPAAGTKGSNGIMKTAVITGASSGLGVEFAKAVASLCPEAEEIWLIARREEKLAQVASLLEGKRTFVLPMDLTDIDGYGKLREALEEKKPDIVYLINNAGFGKLGDYQDIGARDHFDIATLNCAAPAAVVNTVLPYMKRGAHIINVCSIAAFAPTPRMTVYCSTKSFIYAFSRALGEELRKDGISVTAVCPGPMDTEFLPIAGIHGNSKMFNSLPRCNVREVAEKTIRASRRGRAVYTNKLLFKLYRIIAKILPHALVVKFTKC